MKESPQRHALARLRVLLSIEQKQLASVLGKSPKTVQAIELGALKPSPEFCNLVSEYFGVQLKCILNNSAVLLDFENHQFTVKSFESHRRSCSAVRVEGRLSYPASLADFLTYISTLLTEAAKKGQLNLVEFRLRTALVKEGTKLGLDGQFQVTLPFKFADEVQDKGGNLFVNLCETFNRIEDSSAKKRGGYQRPTGNAHPVVEAASQAYFARFPVPDDCWQKIKPSQPLAKHSPKPAVESKTKRKPAA